MYQNNSSGRDAYNFNMPRARVAHAANNLRSDVPPEELNNRQQSPRRLCDGSLARNDAVGGFDNVDHGCAPSTTCGIGCTGWGLNNHPVAMVYSPCQPWNNVYKPEIALERGTVFKDLDLPFEGSGRRGGCL